jgi:ATPase subunit of ABC transporter with duplicated ATPase domains
MSAAIALSDVAWSTPDGRTLFNNLDLVIGRERIGLVGRNGVGKTTLLRLVAGDLKPQAGACAVHGRLGVFRQLVQADPTETAADLFGAREGLAVLARAACGQASEADIAAADWTLEERIAAALARFGVDAPAETPLGALSGGQRTRANLAAMFFRQPDILLLDEPTNNLDRDGRTAVAEALAGWRSAALVVSHDRELLEIMDGVVELTSLGASRYGGGWSAYQARKAIELAAAREDLAEAERQVALAARTAQANVERKARRDGAGKRKAARGGQPRILLGMMKDRAETSGGEQARVAERRREEAQAAAAAARERIEILQPLAVDIPGSGLAAHKPVLRIDGVTAGYAPGRPVLRDFSLAITGPERIAVTGPNGSGKTTLLALITGALAPWKGEVRTLTRFALLDQRADLLDRRLSIRDNFRRLHPGLGETACRAALARFMFRAEAALQAAGALSAGQLLRAGLACVLGAVDPPPLLILDEPTDNLDLDSVEAVQAGLRAYDGALLVVSHDEAFLEAIGLSRRVELAALRAQGNESGLTGGDL